MKPASSARSVGTAVGASLAGDVCTVPVLRLPGGVVVLQGRAVDLCAAAMEHYVKTKGRPNGGSVPTGWSYLTAQLRVSAGDRTAAGGSAAVPQSVELPPSVHDLVDTQEAARMLGCQPRNVRDLVARGVLDSGHRVGGRLLVERDEVEAEVRRRTEALATSSRRGRRAS